MGIHQLTNIPPKSSKLEIRPVVDGQNILIVCAERNAAPGDHLVMTSTYVGDHMMEKPELLREMYGHDLAAVIRFARDIGYRQAQADMRAALGLEK